MELHFDVHEVTEKEKKELEKKMQEHPDNILMLRLTENGEVIVDRRKTS